MAVKLAKKQKKKENAGQMIVTSFLEYISVLWVIVMAFALALYMKDGYFQIGTAKYNAFAHVAVFGMPVLLLLVILYLIFTIKETKISLSGTKQMLKNLSVTDRFVIAYLLFALLSFVCSGHMKESFWGYNGWFMGLFSQMVFVLMYFIFSRFLKDYPITLGAVCAVAFYVFLLGVLHRLLIDPIGVYENLEVKYKNQFLSTLGQASWYSGFMITILPLGMFFFWYFKNYVLRILAGIFVFVGFMTMVSQNTDSAYFGFLAATLVLFHVSVKDAGSMRRFFEVMLLFVLAPKCMQLLLKIWPNDIMWWDTLSRILITSNKMWFWAVLCIGMIVLFAVLQKKEKYPAAVMYKLRTVAYILLFIFLLACVCILVMGANGWLPAGIAAWVQKIPYLTWNNLWGNQRGFTWSFTANMYAEMGLKNKLIGVGPDCYAIYAHGAYTEILKEQWGGSILTNAHNEWFNMLINTGLFGAAAYLGIFVSALVRFVKHSDGKPVLIGLAACIAAYMAHNLFCYQQVLCTPFVFVFMAIGEYQLRKKEK